MVSSKPLERSSSGGAGSFGLPESSQQAVDQICAAFTGSKAGQHVEVGCKEGLGRTGTVLACMAVLAGVPPEKAVSWVREHYHRHAVKTLIK